MSHLSRSGRGITSDPTRFFYYRSHLFFMSSTQINLTEKQKTACKKSGILCVFCGAVPTCLCQLVRRKKGGQLASLCRYSSSSAYCLRSKQALLQSIVSTHTSHAVACRRPTTAARGRTPSASGPWFLLSLAFLLGLATAQCLGEVVP